MYLCYLDETGVSEPSGTTHFVLAGLAIPHEMWQQCDSQITKVKADYGLQDSELHTAWMCRKYAEQNRIPDFDQLDYESRRICVKKARNDYLSRLGRVGRFRSVKDTFRRTDDFIHLNLRERLECVYRIADMISSWKDVALFATAYDKAFVYKDEGSGAPVFEKCFIDLVERFNAFLAFRSHPGSEQQHGLLIQDDDEKNMAHRLTRIMRSSYATRTHLKNLDRIVETPLFVDSQLTSIVQLADLCAYATRRFYENREVKLFDRIANRFVDSDAGSNGLRHLTSNKCDCLACAIPCASK